MPARRAQRGRGRRVDGYLIAESQELLKVLVANPLVHRADILDEPRLPDPGRATPLGDERQQMRYRRRLQEEQRAPTDQVQDVQRRSGFLHGEDPPPSQVDLHLIVGDAVPVVLREVGTDGVGVGALEVCGERCDSGVGTEGSEQRALVEDVRGVGLVRGGGGGQRR